MSDLTIQGGATPIAAPSDVDRALAAGLWLGEGSAGVSYTIRKSGRQKGRDRWDRWAAIEMSDEWEVRLFQRIVGFGRVRALTPREDHHKPTWIWRVGARKDVRRLYELLGPWLSDRRCLQFEVATCIP